MAISELRSVRCAKCGQEIQFIGRQYSKHCQCGNMVTLPFEKPKAVCSICNDTGYVVIVKQKGGQIYEYGYRCVCDKGRDNPKKGIPMAVNVDLSMRI